MSNWYNVQLSDDLIGNAVKYRNTSVLMVIGVNRVTSGMTCALHDNVHSGIWGWEAGKGTLLRCLDASAQRKSFESASRVAENPAVLVFPAKPCTDCLDWRRTLHVCSQRKVSYISNNPSFLIVTQDGMGQRSNLATSAQHGSVFSALTRPLSGSADVQFLLLKMNNACNTHSSKHKNCHDLGFGKNTLWCWSSGWWTVLANNNISHPSHWKLLWWDLPEKQRETGFHDLKCFSSDALCQWKQGQGRPIIQHNALVLWQYNLHRRKSFNGIVLYRYHYEAALSSRQFSRKGNLIGSLWRLGPDSVLVALHQDAPATVSFVEVRKVRLPNLFMAFAWQRPHHWAVALTRTHKRRVADTSHSFALSFPKNSPCSSWVWKTKPKSQSFKFEHFSFEFRSCEQTGGTSSPRFSTSEVGEKHDTPSFWARGAQLPIASDSPYQLCFVWLFEAFHTEMTCSTQLHAYNTKRSVC